MTKEQLIEFIGKELPTPQHPEMIALAVGRAFNQLLYTTFRKDMSNLDLYTRAFNTTIREDGNVLYTTIPSSIVQLPVPGDGIRMISPTKEKGMYFSPMGEHAMRAFEAFDTPSSYVGWCIRNGRIEYQDTTVRDITISLIPPFEAYDDDDEVHIPSGADVQLISLAHQFLNIMPPEKKTIDSNERTR